MAYSQKISCHCGNTAQYRCCYKGPAGKTAFYNEESTDGIGSRYPVGLPSFANIWVDTVHRCTYKHCHKLSDETISYYHCCSKCLPEEVGVSVYMECNLEGWEQIEPNSTLFQYTGYQELLALDNSYS